MSINFAQIHVSLATDGIYALPIVREKESIMLDDRPKSVFRDRFYRLVDAWWTARHYELPRTTAQLQQKLEAMGGWQDEHGSWDYETRPIKPIDDAAGTDIAAGWEV